jgi:hypothetical protein
MGVLGWVAILGVLGVAALVVAGAAWVKRTAMPPPRPLTGTGEVTRITSIQFPAGSAVIDGVFQAGMSQYLAAKVSIPRGRVDDFLGQPSIRGHTSTTERHPTNYDVPFAKPLGWNPDAVTHFVSAELHGVPVVGALCYLLVDLDGAGKATVYVYWQGP